MQTESGSVYSNFAPLKSIQSALSIQSAQVPVDSHTPVSLTCTTALLKRRSECSVVKDTRTGADRSFQPLSRSLASWADVIKFLPALPDC